MVFKSNSAVPKIIIFLVLLILIVALISSIWPKQEEFFIELGLLGKNKTADEYFANADATVEVNAESNWYIYIYNHMNKIENLSIRVKLVNSTMLLPDDLKQQPSSAPFFVELPLLLSVNETAFIPFIWKIAEIKTQNDSIIINRLTVNGALIETDFSSAGNSGFLMVFELWVQNEFSREYHYGWASGDGYRSASLHIGFKLKSTL